MLHHLELFPKIYSYHPATSSIMGFSHRFNPTTIISAIIMRFQEIEKLTFREIFFPIFFHYLINTFSLVFCLLPKYYQGHHIR